MDSENTTLHGGADSERPSPATSVEVAANAGTLTEAAEFSRMKGVGETLNGRFVLEKCIGFGSMGTVYKAFDLRQLEGAAGKPYVAVKVFNTSLHSDPDLQHSMEREIQKLHALRHPNVLEVEALHLDDSLAYFTMEYVAGSSLNQILNASGFSGMPVQQVLPIVGGIVKALAYAQGQGCLHCDLKPANILLTPASHVKVMDFGLAQVLQQAKEKTELSVLDTSMLRGLTRAYVSAELLAGEPPDARDDIYALACITYQLLTGRHPFHDMLATQAREMRLEPIPPKQLSPQQWHGLRNALVLERQARTPDLMQFFSALRDMPRTPRPRVQGMGAPALAMVGMASIVALVAVQHYRATDAVAEAKAAFAEISGIGTRIVAKLVSVSGSATSTSAGPSGTAGVTATSSANPIAMVTAPALPEKIPAQPLALASVTPVLAGIPCSALAATVTDNTIDVKGFVSRGYGIAQLNTTLAKIPGVENMKLDVQQIGEKDCAVVQLFAPYWQKSRAAGASVRPRSGDTRMTEGDALVVDIKTPDHGTWVYADYYALDGGVIHLLPSLRARDNQAPPSYSATVGSAGNWIVSPPFGTEMVVLLTTPTPLFGNVRPEREGTPGYLAALETQLRQIESANGAERITVEFLQIQTQPKK